jgi:dTDP-4-amino-4,6-dideoxygalactose transaminase
MTDLMRSIEKRGKEMIVPFVDLKAQYASIKEEIDAAIEDVVTSSAFSGGPFVAGFEKEFADFCDGRHGVGVGSGTEAIWLILKAMGVGSGDEVITVPNTFIATAEAILLSGATPVFVDVNPDNYTMDPNLLEKAITKKTKAVIPVHLYGHPADMDSISRICRKRGIRIIEDACQAHGAEYEGRRTGSLGDAAAFSFYPGKNLGAYGEAGAVVTNDLAVAEKVRVLRDHGQTSRYHHEVNGWNGRMDGIQGAVLSVKLRHLERWNEARRRIASQYDMLLDSTMFCLPKTAENVKHIFHIYAIRVQHREALIEELKDSGISFGIHYPIPIHLQEAFRWMNLGIGTFPVSELCSEQVLSLPMYAELDSESVGFVCEKLNSAISKQRAKEEE